MKTIFIRPLDTQFYRDGRPFDAGIETDAYTLFPPYPRTIYGALRSLILSSSSKVDWQMGWQDNEQLKEVVGTFDSFGTLTIKGPLVAMKIYLNGRRILYQNHFPPPQDLFKIKGNNEYRFIKPQGVITLSESSNLKFKGIYPTLPEGDEELEAVEDLLPQDYLPGYLTENPENIALMEKDKIFQLEYKTGIRLSRQSRSVTEGFLYTIPQIRMKRESDTEAGLVVDVDNDNALIPDSGILKMGGENRPFEYETISPIDWNPIKEAVKINIIQTGRFKLYLITPGIFQNGWYPDFLYSSDNGLEGKIPGTEFKIRLVGACVGRRVPIGGFDIAKKHPKEMIRAVPAGSVYFFQFLNWNNNKEDLVNALLNSFFYQPIANREEYRKEGFNLVLIGGW